MREKECSDTFFFSMGGGFGVLEVRVNPLFW